MRRTLAVALIGAFAIALAGPAAGSARPVVASPAATAGTAGSASRPDPFAHRDEGRVLDPTRDVERIKRNQRAAGALEPLEGDATADTSTAITGFLTTPNFAPPKLGIPYRPYDDRPIVAKPASTASAGTVQSTSGTSYTHPVRYAQASFLYSNSYRVTKDPAYLTAAQNAAQKLVDIKVVVGDAWFYPYDFDFAVHGDTTETLKAPWYSAMAQGYALTAFVRLFEHTGEARWKTAADATFQALRHAPQPGLPWVSWVDADSNLWLEEYPRPQVTNSEKVLNGHGFAAYGLYDYWNLTGDPEALRLFNGGSTTMERLILSEFRVPNYASYYSLRHKVRSITYHQVHIDEFVKLYQLTRRPRYATAANAYRTDFPSRYSAVQTVQLTPRATRAYQLDANKAIVRSRTVSFSRNTSAPGNVRLRLPTGQIMLRISSGPYTDWWFPERYSAAWMLGPRDVQRHVPRALAITLLPATYTAYRYDSAGRRSGAKVATISTATTVSTAATATIDGRGAMWISSGTFAGHWVPLTSTMINR